MLIRFIAAIITLIAITAQYHVSSAIIPNFTAINFFSFFTILSNLFAACVFLVSVFVRNSVVVDYLRGASTLCNIGYL